MRMIGSMSQLTVGTKCKAHDVDLPAVATDAALILAPKLQVEHAGLRRGDDRPEGEAPVHGVLLEVLDHDEDQRTPVRAGGQLDALVICLALVAETGESRDAPAAGYAASVATVANTQSSGFRLTGARAPAESYSRSPGSGPGRR